MATAKQIAANRRNGSLGRGPKTSAGKASSSRNALKHGLSIPVNRDKTLRRQIEVLARILAQSEAGNVFKQAWAAAEAELELARARAVLEALLTRAGITAECAGNRSRRKLRFANNRHGRLLGIREAGNDSWPPSSTGALTDDRLRSSGASSSS